MSQLEQSVAGLGSGVQLIDLEDSRGPRHLRRCFMHGKACTLIGQFGTQHKPCESTEEHGCMDNAPPGADQKRIFVAMPFRANLDTFYEWSLKNYLLTQIKGITEADIARADEYRNIGYVMCEKVCRRIQAASMVVVDVSTQNPNVFYEFGLAAGLEKQLLITYCQKEGGGDPSKEPELVRIAEQTGFAAKKVLIYPNVGYIDQEKKPLSKHLQSIPAVEMPRGMRVARLLSGAKPKKGQDADDDITVSFPEVLDAALGVALKEMLTGWNDRHAAAERKCRSAESMGEGAPGRNVHVNRAKATLASIQAYREAIIGLQNSLYVPSEKDDGQEQNERRVSYRRFLTPGDGKFRDVSRIVESSFACVIDLGGEMPASYFWLGYCHARGINVIPIYHELCEPRKHPHSDRAGNELSSEATADPTKKKEQDEHVLAFDIRALWYIDHRHQEPHKLAPLVKGVMELLIARDVPRFERNRFWERLTHGQQVHIFTGAVNSTDPRREMVGDWDLRTVSELVRSMASTHESVIPVLEPPISSPRRATVNLKEYIEHLSNLLAGKNCLIIASADVNPMTEIALGKAYGVMKKCFTQGTEYDVPIVAIKGNVSSEPPKKSDLYPTYFSRHDREIAQNHRGFKVRGQPIHGDEYCSAEDAAKRKEPFFVLAHLVVMRNPFGIQANGDTYIVILGGVSGPATFGLAEVLTGGTAGNAVVSEQLLRAINTTWDDHKEDTDFVGVEAIVRVEVTSNPKDPNRFADVRSVTGWSILGSVRNITD